MQEYMKTLNISELQLPARVYLKLMRDNVTTVEKLANCDIFKYNFSESEIENIQHCFREYTGEPLNITTQQPAPQPTIIQSEEHIKAVALHQKIMTSIELINRNLWDMCTSLKEMRDNKLYKEFGYKNFEDYCKNEFGMTRSNAYNYISIAERVNSENVQSIGQIGMTKLSLLATISQEQQAEIAEKVDLENTTVKKLKEEIAQLKARNDDFQTNIEISEKKISELQSQNAEWESKHDTLEEENNGLWKENEQLHKQVRELESRPVEVAVLEPEPSDNERLLQETIRNLQIESQKRDEELERQYREDEKAVRQMLEKQKQQALQQLTNEYEEKIKNLSAENSVSDVNVNLEIAEALISTATKIVRQIRGLALNDDENIYQYSSKLKNLIYAIEKDINDMERLSQ